MKYILYHDQITEKKNRPSGVLQPACVIKFHLFYSKTFRELSNLLFEICLAKIRFLFISGNTNGDIHTHELSFSESNHHHIEIQIFRLGLVLRFDCAKKSKTHVLDACMQKKYHLLYAAMHYCRIFCDPWPDLHNCFLRLCCDPHKEPVNLLWFFRSDYGMCPAWCRKRNIYLYVGTRASPYDTIVTTAKLIAISNLQTNIVIFMNNRP